MNHHPADEFAASRTGRIQRVRSPSTVTQSAQHIIIALLRPLGERRNVHFGSLFCQATHHMLANTRRHMRDAQGAFKHVVNPALAPHIPIYGAPHEGYKHAV